MCQARQSPQSIMEIYGQGLAAKIVLFLLKVSITSLIDESGKE